MYVSIALESILAITEMESTIKMQYGVAIAWTDNRLTFYDLHDNPSLNIITKAELRTLWLPDLILQNTATKSHINVASDSKIAMVEKRGQSSQNSLDNPYNIAEFDGGQNPFLVFAFQVHEFICDFDMTMYPFDVQTCYMDINPGKELEPFISLKPWDLKQLDRIPDFGQYVVDAVNISEYTRHNEVSLPWLRSIQ